jgi:ribosome-binding ATPase
MEIGLIGLSGCGKSTCFAALTGLPATHGGGNRLGTVSVPEPRVLRLAEIYHSRKLSYAEIVIVDTPALETGHGASAIEKRLARLAQEADAFVLIVRCFGELDHAGSPLDPRGDLEALLLELAFADLAVTERRLERVKALPKKDRGAYEEHLLERLQAHLGAGHPAFRLTASAEEEKLLRGYALITMRPLMVAANVSDSDLAGEAAAGVMEVAAANELPCLHFCATLEAEIAQLSPEEQAAFLSDYGLSAPARDRLIRAAYDLLDVMTFLTAGESESHAWTVRRGARAPEASGKVHSDFEQSFIRAEVVHFDDMDRYGSLAECRKHGTVRLEGKEYVVKDGDVLDIRFSR